MRIIYVEVALLVETDEQVEKFIEHVRTLPYVFEASEEENDDE